jgi:hypothetical protein
MTTDFATALASRLTEHQAFWDDFHKLQARGFRSTLGEGRLPAIPSDQSLDPQVLHRLLYCASILAQTPSETNKSVAQSIVLNSILSDTTDPIRERTVSLLASMGNFPSLNFVQSQYGDGHGTLLGFLNLRMLRALNSVRMGELSLTDFQIDVWNSLPRNCASSISAPTSAGKSFVVIEYLCQTVLESSGAITVVYIAPTRALLAEVHKKISARFVDDATTRVSTVPAPDAEARPKQIFVLTQERLHVLLAIMEISADIVVADEAQNLADGSRGMILQDCLERLRQANSNAKIILLSPGASGFEDVARVLGLGTIEERETVLSPVLQNLVEVKIVAANAKALRIGLINRQGTTDVGVLRTERGVADKQTRLAAAALELGQHGGSLIYATGPVEAEKIAAQLSSDGPALKSKPLVDLSQFIKDHIHPEYGLADMVLHGVGFHYGRMPTLLREALENAFRTGDVKFLVCTTTLFQGVNLPARSVFINTPTRGKGTSLEPAQIWNFAGRAGRLGKDLVGNVFLVDYDKWPEPTLSTRSQFNVSPALSATVEGHFDAVIDAISGTEIAPSRRSAIQSSVQAAAGLMMARASTNRASAMLGRISSLSEKQRYDMEATSRSAAESLGLPSTLIESNWTVDLHGLQRLSNRMREKIAEGELDDLMPIHPREAGAFERFSRIFGRIGREIMGLKGQAIAKYGAMVATYAVPWMNGAPYPVLLRRWITFKRGKKPNASVNDHIRGAFEFFEDIIRFQMVQFGKAYVDVLQFVLSEGTHANRRAEVFDYALALELGVSSTSGRAFIELGTSRITAVALEALFPNSELTAPEARARLASLDIAAAGLSPIIIAELRQLQLISNPLTPHQNGR